MRLRAWPQRDRRPRRDRDPPAFSRCSRRSTTRWRVWHSFCSSIHTTDAAPHAASTEGGATRVIHGSLKGLLQEVKDRKVEAVRVAAFMQSDVVSNGMPRYTAWIVVTAVLEWDLWTEWRLLVGRGHAELTES